MSLGLVVILLTLGAAGWLIYRVASGTEGNAPVQNVTILKFVVLLGLVAVLSVAKLWPLAFMVLVAAGGVMAIESWRDKNIQDDITAMPDIPMQKSRMNIAEAASVLGVDEHADIEAINASYKKLIAQIHPDKGGTDYLASKINEARDILIADRSRIE